MTGCQSERAPEPEPERRKASAAGAPSGEPSQQAKAKKKKEPGLKTAAKTQPTQPRRKPGFAKVTPRPVKAVKPTPGDPTGGKFALEDATRGLDGTGDRLLADIKTPAGTLECTLYADEAPITVANFVGLARGTRPWNEGGKWVKKPLYDGGVFHRIIKGFMIQGGDPKGDGSGGPGYVIPDEIWGGNHDERGLLCMANRGPDTNGSQFFILDGPAPHLDRSYTIFGKCGPDELIEKLASSPTKFQRAVDPPKIEKVSIRRGS